MRDPAGDVDRELGRGLEADDCNAVRLHGGPPLGAIAIEVQDET